MESAPPTTNIFFHECGCAGPALYAGRWVAHSALRYVVPWVAAATSMASHCNSAVVCTLPALLTPTTITTTPLPRAIDFLRLPPRSYTTYSRTLCRAWYTRISSLPGKVTVVRPGTPGLPTHKPTSQPAARAKHSRGSAAVLVTEPPAHEPSTRHRHTNHFALRRLSPSNTLTSALLLPVVRRRRAPPFIPMTQANLAECDSKFNQPTFCHTLRLRHFVPQSGGG